MRSKDQLQSEFTEIMEQHKGLIYKVAYAYCKDPLDQQDLVQEVILQLWKSFPKYDPKYKITTWMYRIALNVAISHYRKAVKREKHAFSIEENLVEIADETEDAKEEELKILNAFIQQLDSLHRALMVLYLDGNNHEEIANVLNISKSNVGTKINRIKEKLKKHFNQK